MKLIVKNWWGGETYERMLLWHPPYTPKFDAVVIL
jgi:hypothetical protein